MGFDWARLFPFLFAAWFYKALFWSSGRQKACNRCLIHGIGVFGVILLCFSFISTYLQLNGCQLINTTIYAILQHIPSALSVRAGQAFSATAEQPALPY